MKKAKYSIIDLNEKYFNTYCVCLEDSSKDMQEAGDHKKCWYDKMKDKGLGVKIAINEENKAIGMIQYTPAEFNLIEGQLLYQINCIWIPPDKKNRKAGIGKALLKAAEEDVKARKAKGIAAWGLSIPVFMKASWFKKQDYKVVDKDGNQILLWKPFEDNLLEPKWIFQKKKPLKNMNSGKITITTFLSGICPVQNLNYERFNRAANEFKDKIVLQKIDTFCKENRNEWGIRDAVFIEDKCVSAGPPMSYKKIRKKIKKAVKKIK